jgi:hypothetical protein
MTGPTMKHCCGGAVGKGPDGGIGRRAGLKHQWPQGCAGSTPAPGTENGRKRFLIWFFRFFILKVIGNL